MTQTPTEKPVILTDVYGRNPPAASQFGVGAAVPAAEFGKGTQAAPQVQQAADAQRRQGAPGDYSKR